MATRGFIRVTCLAVLLLQAVCVRSSSQLCKEEGRFPHPDSCGSYVDCLPGPGDDLVAREGDCHGFPFSPSLRRCVSHEEYPECVPKAARVAFPLSDFDYLCDGGASSPGCIHCRLAYECIGGKAYIDPCLEGNTCSDDKLFGGGACLPYNFTLVKSNKCDCSQLGLAPDSYNSTYYLYCDPNSAPDVVEVYSCEEGKTFSNVTNDCEEAACSNEPVVPACNGQTGTFVNPNQCSWYYTCLPDGSSRSSCCSEPGQGSVKASIYLQYFLAGGGWFLLIVLCLANVITQVLFSGTDYWLSYWANGEQIRARLLLEASENMTLAVNGSAMAVNGSAISYQDAPVPEGYLDTITNVYVYAGLTAALFVLSLGRTVLFFVMCMTSSRNLHNRMFQSVIRVPIKFFDTHPVGQILNRFTKDLGQVDELLPITVFDVVTILLNFLGIIAVIASINIWVLIPTLGLGVIFVFLRRFYLSTARDVKRLEGITRSPVFSHLSASLQGLTTIRAFEAQQIFMDDFDTHQDLHSSAWFLFLCTTRWFGICLDWISCIYIAIVTYSFMGTQDSLGGDIGLAISSAMMLSGMFQWGVRQSAEVENQMTSVERVLEYAKLEPEAALETDEDKTPKAGWPEKGEIRFEDVSLQYNPNDAPVLKNLNFCIKANEKIGIVGRTGAGKSSMLTSLFRLTEPVGVIYIDNIAVKELGLHDVRGNISIIPQDPTLFSGTMRRNLDPFDQYEDEDLWRALEEVQLKDAVSDLEGGLEAVMSEGGSNLSVGQRQLVCLARAILRHNRILVLDEATANVDPRTDGLIQQTIRSKFRNCTVLTIAHRLHTIMDSDRVMVLEAGRLEEFDEPYILLRNPTSMFTKLVEQTGKAATDQLRLIAGRAYQAKHGQVANLSVEEESTREATQSTSSEDSQPQHQKSEDQTLQRPDSQDDVPPEAGQDDKPAC